MNWTKLKNFNKIDWTEVNKTVNHERINKFFSKKIPIKVYFLVDTWNFFFPDFVQEPTAKRQKLDKADSILKTGQRACFFFSKVRGINAQYNQENLSTSIRGKTFEALQCS